MRMLHFSRLRHPARCSSIGIAHRRQQFARARRFCAGPAFVYSVVAFGAAPPERIPSPACNAPLPKHALADAGSELPSETGFVSLFDGTTFSGWTPDLAFSAARGEIPGARWRIKDGAIVGSADSHGRGGFLWLDRAFEDFVLRLQVRLAYPIDSGVFLRVGPTGRSHQVMLDYVPGGEIGAIYIPFERRVHANPEGIRALRPDAWNDLEIRIEGEPARIRVWLNAILITDFQHTAASNQGASPRGGIALQAHPPRAASGATRSAGWVGFRRIRMKELPRPSGDSPTAASDSPLFCDL